MNELHSVLTDGANCGYCHKVYPKNPNTHTHTQHSHWRKEVLQVAKKPTVQRSFLSTDLMAELKSPTDLKVIILSSTSAIMSWRDPMHGIRYAEDGRGDGSSTYTVRYGPRVNGGGGGGGQVSNYTYLNPPYFPSLYLVALTPNTLYEFSVRLNRGGRGKRHSAWSTPVLNKTLEAGRCSCVLLAAVGGSLFGGWEGEFGGGSWIDRVGYWMADGISDGWLVGFWMLVGGWDGGWVGCWIDRVGYWMADGISDGGLGGWWDFGCW